ncbi:MAG: dTDP-4-dehydrorhamnose reductase [Acidobacteria bacterium RIFCSPLOWO2_12_FULL_66_21]|nr:MAG: dTDP-4-dehydrorhamnose reductase [Acidobacteria bacterium RIFCSPLOWO2_12_FULL_66_21]
MRILVAGAPGQLGQAITERLSAAHTVVALGRADLDLTSEPDVLRLVEAEHPDVIVNCAAYNAVDDAEDNASEALAVNAFAVLGLARAARACRATLVHFGSDFVFDGRADRPYVETDEPRPESNYALSKLLGEWFAADAPRWYVLRVESLFGGPRAKSSVDRILEALRAGEPARVFIDRTVTPSFVEDVAGATAQLLERRPPSGIYHCVNSGPTTWLGIAEEAARLLGCQPDIVPISVRDVTLKAKRPQYCALSNEKLREAGIDMPPWQDALRRYVLNL